MEGEGVIQVGDHQETGIPGGHLKGYLPHWACFISSKDGTTCMGKPGSFKGPLQA